MPDELETRIAALEPRVSALESRIDTVAEDASAARHLAAARDRDLADLTIKVDANRKAINALSLQTAGGFAEMRVRFEQVDARFEQVDARLEQVDARFEQVDKGFAEMRARFDQTAAGLQRIVDLLDPGSGAE